MQFGKYLLLKKLGTGGMAEVFLAKENGLAGFERLVCIKRVLPHLAEHTEFITMFQDEARIAANLNHPNIVQIYELGEIDKSYFIAMELIKGEDVRQIYNAEVARGRIIPYVNAAQIIYGACNGLGFAHASCDAMGKPLGLVHRDISPQNILVTYNGYPKIVDFGVAKARGKMTETRAGVLKGKYSYMSPEQAKGKAIDGRSDIFATGVVLYEITTGQRLFKRENEIETLHAVMNCRVTPPTKLIPNYPPELERIVMRSLAADVNNRYATCYDFAADLEKFIISQGGSTSPQALAAYMQDLFADKLKDDPYSPARLEEMTKQAETIVLAGHTPARSNSPEATVPGNKNARYSSQRMGRTTLSIVKDINGNDVEVLIPNRRFSPMWGMAIVLFAVALIVGILAYNKKRSAEDQKRMAEEISRIQQVNKQNEANQQLAMKLINEQRAALQEQQAASTKPEEKAEEAPAEPAAEQEKPTPKITPQNGKLQLSGDGSWHILIDGKDKGSVSQGNITLPAGRYKIKLVHQKHGTIFNKGSVVVKAGHTVEVSPPSGKGNIFVNAIPYAKVWLGNQHTTDDTPKSYQKVPVGEYIIHAECENGKRLEQSAKVTDGGLARVVFNCDK